VLPYLSVRALLPAVAALCFLGDTRASSCASTRTLTVVRREGPDRYQVEAQVPAKPGAGTMALDPKRHLLYLPTARFGPAAPPSPEEPRPRPQTTPGTFEILVAGAEP